MAAWSPGFGGGWSRGQDAGARPALVAHGWNVDYSAHLTCWSSQYCFGVERGGLRAGVSGALLGV